MEYQIIQPPFTFDFRVWSKKQAQAYFDWFMMQLPVRIQILARAVQSTCGYEHWRADEKPGSLAPLGQWFYDHVEIRQRTIEEKDYIYDNAPKWFREVEINDWELTNQTYSLAIDVGMYVGHMIEVNLPGVMWEVYRERRDAVDYNQPVLVSNNKPPMNPVRLLIVCASSFADGTRAPDNLSQIYDTWAKILSD